MLSRRPFLIILSAPSGAGKTTLCRALVEQDANIDYSVSATTRPRRSGEIEGKDYFFLTKEEFLCLIEEDGLLEWEEVYGYYYGTPRSRVQELLDSRFDVIFDLDIKGALNLKKHYPDCVTIFLLPPSLAELQRRLVERGREEAEIIEDRFSRARDEINMAREFDYVVINDHLDESVRQLLSIVTAERLRTPRVIKIELMEDL